MSLCGKHLRCQGHSDGVRNALSQGARRDFHARRHSDFWMSRGYGVPLPESLDIIQGDFEAPEVQERILQHGGVSAGQKIDRAIFRGWLKRMYSSHTREQCLPSPSALWMPKFAFRWHRSPTF